MRRRRAASDPPENLAQPALEQTAHADDIHIATSDAQTQPGPRKAARERKRPEPSEPSRPTKRIKHPVLTEPIQSLVQAVEYGESPVSRRVAAAAARLRDVADTMVFGAPVSHVYNPYNYAWPTVEQYIHKHARTAKRVLYLGMNPGPFGMAQTGVPFGDVQCVRDFVGVFGPVAKPPSEHPKRPIHGFQCARREVSGTRFWGLMAELHTDAARFFHDAWVHNYCPLAFMAAQGANITPDKLPAHTRDRLFAACDQALLEMVAALQPRVVIGVGKFAEDRARKALANSFPGVQIGCIPHPSPANPRANKCWAADTRAILGELGLLGDAS